ncbi:hypothetical protein [Nocardioides sp. URHA0020]|uniref:hypothetical protein n=1 Tax=Nocardioides sp. URHA0020 TaxID=1380392 RepID=UPI000688BBA7|nr:hypothetical protein [Nocardioides sp. URHA0020]
MTTAGDQPSNDDVAELRREVARLKQQLGETGTVALPTDAPARRGWWRPVVATALIVIMAVLVPLSVVARWAHDTVSDTDRYIETVAPLANDPAVQTAVIERVTTEIVTRLQVDDVTDQAVDALAERGLPPLAAGSLKALSTPLADAIEGFVKKQVTAIVKSDEFETAWIEANRQAHTQMVALLTGKDTDLVDISDRAVSVNLATIIETVKQRLVARGFALAERLPTINAQFTIFESDDITKAQTGFRLLSAANTALPIVALLCLFGAVAVGRNRRRTLVAGSLAVVAAVILLGVALNAARVVYLDAVPTDQLPTDAAAAIYDTLVYFIRLNIRALLVLFLAIAFIAWVTGPVGAPVALRGATTRAIGATRSRGERVGINTGRFGTTLGTYQTPIRVGLLGIALLLYVLRDHPTGEFTLWLVVVVGVLLLIVELLARPPVPAVEPSPTAGAPGPS